MGMLVVSENEYHFMTLNLSSKTMIAVLAACSLTLQGCASTHYSMQTTATKGIQENYLPDSRFNINLIKQPYGNIEDSDKALYRAVVSGFTGNGLQLTDQNVNSYVTNNENIYQIEIDFMHRRDLGGASTGVLWALSFMTLFIFPLALSEEIETKVKLFNTSEARPQTDEHVAAR